MRLWIASASLMAGCMHPGTQVGIWLHRHEPVDPNVHPHTWMELRPDGSFTAHLPQESFDGSYVLDGKRLRLHANHDMDCEVAGDVMHCDNDPGAIFVRVSTPPATTLAQDERQRKR